jgi:hypothetical protein
MSTFYSEFIANKKNIVIPRIQRDYVQGQNKSIIKGFIEELRNSLINHKKIDLNYIYGSFDKDSNFTAIDGQQRLTTLWLLYFYISARAGETLSVDLIYQDREYAESFVKALKANAQSKHDYEENSFKDFIENQPWFLLSWKKDTSVVSMIETLSVINDSFRDGTDFSELWDNIINTGSDQITFSFKDVGGLNDDVYIKMNSRGRPLSEFENLKSWMDGKISECWKEKPEKVQEWQQHMDNEWTDLFWNNRNQNQEHPEEIDDEQLRLFYNLMYLYWIKEHNDESLFDKADYEKIKFLLSISDGDDKYVDTKVLERIKSKEHFALPLYVLEKSKFFDENTFDFILQCLNQFSEKIEELNKTDLYFWKQAESQKATKIFYQMALSEESYEYKRLALTYAVSIFFQENTSTDNNFAKWLYHLRNIIINTDINVYNFKKILDDIDTLSSNCKKNDIDEFLQNVACDEFKGFDKKQIGEEKIKSRIIISKNESLIKEMKQLENHPFFVGQIKWIFNFLGESPDVEKFTAYSKVMRKLFDSDGLALNNNTSFRKALMSCTTEDWTSRNGSIINFMYSKTDMKAFLSGSEGKYLKNVCLKQLIEKILSDGKKDADNNDLEKNINDIADKIDYKTSFLEKDWRYYFCKYDEVWNYMAEGNCCFENNNKVIILSKERINSYHVELRSYCMYQDYRKDKSSKIKEWDIGYYDSAETDESGCLYFDRYDISGARWALDVNYNQNDSEEYVISFFIQDSEYNYITEKYTEQLAPFLQKYGLEFRDNKKDRYYSKSLSKDNVKISELTDQLNGIIKGK